MSARPIEDASAPGGGEPTPFQVKLDRIVRRIGVTGIARRTGLAPQTISDWRKHSWPRLDQVQKLARGLRMPTAYFADDAIPPRDWRDATREDGSSRVTEGRAGEAAEKLTDYPAEKKGG